MNQLHPIYIVDDDSSIRRSLKFIFDNLHWPARSFSGGDVFLKELADLQPGCVLLDVRMPGRDGMAVHRELKAHGSIFPVIVMTGHGDTALAVRAMKEGAIDFLEKPLRRDDLLAALEQGCARLDDREHASRTANAARIRVNALTDREREVLAGLAAGHPNKSIAYDLGISPRTVEVHRANIMDKLAARSLSDVLRLAFAAGLPNCQH